MKTDLKQLLETNLLVLKKFLHQAAVTFAMLYRHYSPGRADQMPHAPALAFIFCECCTIMVGLY